MLRTLEFESDAECGSTTNILDSPQKRPLPTTLRYLICKWKERTSPEPPPRYRGRNRNRMFQSVSLVWFVFFLNRRSRLYLYLHARLWRKLQQTKYTASWKEQQNHCRPALQRQEKAYQWLQTFHRKAACLTTNAYTLTTLSKNCSANPSGNSLHLTQTRQLSRVSKRTTIFLPEGRTCR